ncbi:hypothetical protein FHW19_004614 [Ochrobactrum anthropi]|nr:hypothetical protein [Brucella anthropi]
MTGNCTGRSSDLIRDNKHDKPLFGETTSKKDKIRN